MNHLLRAKLVRLLTSECLTRPAWDEYFMMMAVVASLRSHDAQTKHGCVIVKNNRILATGYNGFPRGMDDSSLPTVRPAKYPYMYHSEVNAVANCLIRPEGATAYVTGPPCNDCLVSMWQHGITKVIYYVGHGTFDAVYDEVVRNKFLADTGMILQEYRVEPNDETNQPSRGLAGAANECRDGMLAGFRARIIAGRERMRELIRRNPPAA